MIKEKCWECGGKMEKRIGYLKEGIEYEFFGCEKCGHKVLTMDQLKNLAEKERKYRESYAIKISKWGTSLAVRIPKSIVVQEKLKEGESVRIFKEKAGFRIMPERSGN